jgi:hypothetical protein
LVKKLNYINPAAYQAHQHTGTDVNIYVEKDAQKPFWGKMLASLLSKNQNKHFYLFNLLSICTFNTS